MTTQESTPPATPRPLEETAVDDTEFLGDSDLRSRLAALSERVCLLSGWAAADTVSERGKALTQAWIEWAEEYRRQGGITYPFHHPELRVKELAAKRDDIVERTLASIHEATR